MKRIGVVLIVAALSACHRTAVPAAVATPAQSTSTNVRVRGAQVPLAGVRGGSVQEFVPAVAAVDSGGKCQDAVLIPGSPPGQRTLVMRFGTTAERSRSVAVTVNAVGTPIRYSDGRGDLRAPFDKSVTADKPLGMRTTIAIDLRDTTAMLRNEGPGAPQHILRVYGPAILTAPNLDEPAKHIARVLAMCAAGAGMSR